MRHVYFTSFLIIFLWLRPADSMGRILSLKSNFLNYQVYQPQDTVELDVDSTIFYNIDPTKFNLGQDSVNVFNQVLFPYTSIQQILKGGASGVYVQEPSAEPGTIKQNMLIRGISSPVLGAGDYHSNRPVVYVNGIPLIEENSFNYLIQDYDLQPVGPATNILSMIDLDNIESIHIMKDFANLGVFGPRASKGAIYITTKNAKAGQRKISVNSYYGVAVPHKVFTTNAEYIKEFRLPYYSQYANQQQQASFPAYLSDSSNVNYYGPSDWTDLFYKATPIYSMNGSLEGGSERSNFRFFASHLSNASGTDDTKFNRYNGAFYINMLPMPWLTVASMIHASRYDRDRNRSLSERFAETRFIPDLGTPLSPNKEMYRQYMDEYDRSIDKNFTNSIQGMFSLNFRILPNLNYSPRFAMDYNEGARDLFWPSTILSSNNYVSNYFGYNERILFDNTVNYKHQFSANKYLYFEGGFNYQSDVHKYNYAVGYRGPNDYIKINKVEGDKSKEDYLKAIGFIPYYYGDRMRFRMASAFGKLTFGSTDLYEISALLRSDGSSAVQSSHRWLTTPVFDGRLKLADVMNVGTYFSSFDLFASWGRLGELQNTDLYAVGPYYASELGWNSHKSVFSYSGIGTYSRPYNTGFVGYDIPWAYTQMFNIGIDVNHQKWGVLAEFYSKDTKNMVFHMPVVAESGYASEVQSGMSVNNLGADITLFGHLVTRDGFSWRSTLNISYNTNKLKALPGGAEEVVIGNRKLKVGERIDRYWLLVNEGIYESDIDVPVHPDNYQILNYHGTPMSGGDPRWKDINGDFVIDDNDRVLTGNIIPKVYGGFTNQFTYKKIDLSFNFYFNFGRKIMNAQSSRYLDFANLEESNSLSSVREITFWEKNTDLASYPFYNPWSSVRPYQTEQDMFMEDGSFVKLKNLSFGYDLTSLLNRNQDTFQRFYLFMTANNLLTISKYKGRDPELVDYFGYDTGLGIRMPRTFTLGLKLDL